MLGLYVARPGVHATLPLNLVHGPGETVGPEGNDTVVEREVGDMTGSKRTGWLHMEKY